jgi:hypothetical protein
MLPGCQTYRAARWSADRTDERADAHPRTCAECARWLAALERREAALSGLARLRAPFELDGSVVQALEAGFRQDRAVRALDSLGRVHSPSELEAVLDAELEASADELVAPADLGLLVTAASRPWAQRLRAPAELDELVAEELRQPAQQRTGRHLRDLRRLSAPAELAMRLERDGWRTVPQRQAARPLVLAGLGLALAALVVTLGLRGRTELEGTRGGRYDFVVENVDGSAALTGFAAGLLDGVSGGLLSAEAL